MKYILALDQGTSSSRAIVVDESGVIKAIAQKQLSVSYPRPGWVEQDPKEIWTTQYQAIQEVLISADITLSDVAAIGITNQRETTIVWNRKTGHAIYNAIVWQDRRTAEKCRWLANQGYESVVSKKTGLTLDPYFSATKISWILDHVEGARQKAENGELAFGTVDSWLIWQLTSGSNHVTDATNASRTLLFNLGQGGWDHQLLEIFTIPEKILPRIVNSSGICGEAKFNRDASTIPVAGVAGDQQAALFGQRCVRAGMAKNTYGTGCFMLLNTGNQAVVSRNKLLTTLAWRRDKSANYALEGSIFMGGAVVQWLRDSLGMIRSSSEVEALAGKVDNNGGVYFVPAFVGLGAPHWDPYARGTIVGLSRGSTSAHIVRAALESIAFQVDDVLAAMQSDANIALSELRVDGGAAQNNLLLQIQADLIGIPVARPQTTETTVLGAAYLAGLGIGYWRDEAELDSYWRLERNFEPKMDRGQALALKHDWRRAVDRARNWIETES
jgi:glycerol kinase